MDDAPDVGTPQLPLAVSMGDPAGIGPEITLKAFANRSRFGLPPFALYACPRTLAERCKHLALDIELVEVGAPGDAASHFDTRLPVVPVPVARTVEPGHPAAENGMATIAAIERATRAVVVGEASALVTNPIAKSVLYTAGFVHPGHTEFLAALAESLAGGRRYHPVMMLASDVLRVVPATIHIPISAVPRSLTRPLLAKTIRITAESLRSDFGIAAPRIAVAGLNPHAGEGGAIGREDADLIAPVVQDLQRDGIDVTGPFSADTMFHPAARATYDAAVCMYHDQALIPIKTLAFDSGVNVTLGLPFVRTSPDHGTAFNIAASGVADAGSFVAALKLGATLAANRRRAAAT